MDDPAFIASILEDKTDRTRRLIYADWLDDHGEAERAARIRERAQIEEEYLRIVTCEDCNGNGGEQLDGFRRIPIYGTGRWREEPCKMWVDCKNCRGSGKQQEVRPPEWNNPLWLLGYSDNEVKAAEKALDEDRDVETSNYRIRSQRTRR